MGIEKSNAKGDLPLRYLHLAALTRVIDYYYCIVQQDPPPSADEKGHQVVFHMQLGFVWSVAVLHIVADSKPCVCIVCHGIVVERQGELC